MRELPKPGDRFCIVQMNGCMGETRGRERWGTVERIEDREVYGSSMRLCLWPSWHTTTAPTAGR